jgi:hypothetical protein
MLTAKGRTGVDNNVSSNLSNQMDVSIRWLNGLTLSALEKVLLSSRRATTEKRQPDNQVDQVTTRVNMVNPEPSAT